LVIEGGQLAMGLRLLVGKEVIHFGQFYSAGVEEEFLEVPVVTDSYVITWPTSAGCFFHSISYHLLEFLEKLAL